MKHIFIVNPVAGKGDSHSLIERALRHLKKPIDYELYLTQAPKDAINYIREYCTEHPAERLRFYACGGDGTLNEVVNGAVGFPNASVGCYPCGSGNDFVKYYGGKKYFFDMDALVNGREEYIDLIRVGDRYSINATHFGFDSCVAEIMMKVRRKKIIGGKNAYATGVVVGLFKAMKNKCRVWVDGELLNPKGTILLCTVSNGQYVGGSFRCAPRSLDNDGLLEVCLVHPVSHIKFLRLIQTYTDGKHLDDPRFEKVISYRRGRKIVIEATDGFVCSLDGELISSPRLEAEVVHRAIRFVVPQGAQPLMGEGHVPLLEREDEEKVHC